MPLSSHIIHLLFFTRGGAMSGPISERKLAANRANAKKSTGPRTPEGKARSSLNAVVHGLAARRQVLPNEDRRAFDAFARALRQDLRPAGAVQALLVEEVIEAAWKLRRAAAAQERVVRHALLRYAGAARKQALTPGRLLADAINGDARAEPFMTLEHYSERLQRSFFSALRRLERARRQETLPSGEPKWMAGRSPRETAASHVSRAVYAPRRTPGEIPPPAQVPATNPISPVFPGETRTAPRAGTR
jgi:hypothetical protein